jgi:hypothetical protein
MLRATSPEVDSASIKQQIKVIRTVLGRIRTIKTKLTELEYEVTLRNHKDIPIVVQVNEPIGGDWEMLSSTYKYTKTAAFAAQFNLPVAKDGTSVLKYRVRAKW